MAKVLRVDGVRPMGLAFQAGIQKDDILVSYNGAVLGTTEELISLASQNNNSDNQLLLVRGQTPIVLCISGGALGVSVVPVELPEDILSTALAGSEEALRIAQRDKEISQKDTEFREDRKRREKEMIVTTAHSIDGYHVIQTLEIVSSECVYGMNIFKDIFAAVTDIVGGRSKTIQKALKEARQECLSGLKTEALDAGANAVIAVDLDYSEMSGGAKNMLFLVATGTAVKIERVS